MDLVNVFSDLTLESSQSFPSRKLAEPLVPTCRFAIITYGRCKSQAISNTSLSDTIQRLVELPPLGQTQIIRWQMRVTRENL